MKCEEFLDRWMEGGWLSRVNFSLYLHWLRCRECREQVAFVRRLSGAMKGREREEEAFFLDMRERLWEAGRREGLLPRDPSPPRSGWEMSRFLLPLAGALLVLVAVLTFLHGHPGRKAGNVWDYPLYSGEGMVFISQLDESTLTQLDAALEGALDEDPSIVADLSTAPWAEVVDQVSAHPYLLDFL